MTTSIVHDRGPSSLGRDREPRRAVSNPTVEALRSESRASLTEVVRMLGYPLHWADKLERRAFATGRVWSTRSGASGSAAI